MTCRGTAAVLALCLSGCNCGNAPSGVVDQCQTDLALPPSVSTDILFVIDNSGSMAAKQQKVVDQLQLFVQSLVSAPVHNDFQLGVVTTGVTQNFAMCDPNPVPTCVSYPDQSGRLQRGKDLKGTVLDPTDKVILVPTDKDFLTVAKRAIGQGISGSGQEMGLEAARLAVTAPLTATATDANPPGNKGFLRPGARLLVIIVSDEDDCSDNKDCSNPSGRLYVQGACGDACTSDAQCAQEADYCIYLSPSDPSLGRRCTFNSCETVSGRALLPSVDSYVQALQGIDDGTGSGRPREFFLAVIGAVDDKLVPARCAAGQDNEAYGVATRYKQAVTLLGENALIDSICNADYAATLSKTADLVNAPQTVDLPQAPPDPHLLLFDITHTTGETITCQVGTGFDYAPPTASFPARATFKGACRLHSGDKLKVKLVCAG